MFRIQENVSRLGGKYSDCVEDDTEWKDLRRGKVVTVEGERYDRKVNYIKLSFEAHTKLYTHKLAQETIVTEFLFIYLFFINPTVNIMYLINYYYNLSE